MAELRRRPLPVDSALRRAVKVPLIGDAQLPGGFHITLRDSTVTLPGPYRWPLPVCMACPAVPPHALENCLHLPAFCRHCSVRDLPCIENLHRTCPGIMVS